MMVLTLGYQYLDYRTQDSSPGAVCIYSFSIGGVNWEDWRKDSNLVMNPEVENSFWYILVGLRI